MDKGANEVLGCDVGRKSQTSTSPQATINPRRTFVGNIPTIYRGISPSPPSSVVRRMTSVMLSSLNGRGPTEEDGSSDSATRYQHSIIPRMISKEQVTPPY